MASNITVVPAGLPEPSGLNSAARRAAWRHYRGDLSVSVAEAAEVAGMTRQALAEVVRSHRWIETRDKYLASFGSAEALPSVALSVLAAAGRRSAALSDLLDRQVLALPANPTLDQIEALSKVHDRLTRLSLDLLTRLIGAPS